MKLFEAQKLRVLAPATLPGFKAKVRRAQDFFQDKDVRQVEFVDLESYQMYLEENFKSLKAKTVKDHLTVVRSFLNWCLKRRIIQFVPPMPDFMIDEPETRWLETGEQWKLLQAIPADDREIVKFLMLSGVRIGEARAVKIRDINLQTESIRIATTFSLNVFHNRRKASHDKKTKPYSVPIHPEMKEFIRGRVERDFGEQYLFLNPRNGQPYSVQALRKIWHKAQTVTGIKIKLYQATRHSVGTQLALAGRSEIAISNQLGHSSTHVTQRYTHGALQMVKDNLAYLGFKGAGEKKDSATGLPLRKN